MGGRSLKYTVYCSRAEEGNISVWDILFHSWGINMKKASRQPIMAVRHGLRKRKNLSAHKSDVVGFKGTSNKKLDNS